MRLPGFAARLATSTFSVLGAAAAQSAAVLPAGAAAAEQSTSLTAPWNGALPQSQTIYPAALFTAQGIDHPITITALRWRAEGGHHHSPAANLQATIALASTPNTLPLWLWADNRGEDFTTVHSGPVTIGLATGTSPNQWAVAAAITPFVYDPFSGRHLLVEVITNGTALLPVDAVPTGSSGGGTLHAPTANAAGATTFTQRLPVVELTYVPTFPLLARFDASTTVGPAPLQVAFTDRSFCADPAGVQTWRWDFDGDGLVDSTLQHPTVTYTACGDHAVTLSVTDAQNRVHTAAPQIVTVDPFTAAFATSVFYGAAPLTVTFTDTSSPTPTAWAWDFDADGLVDSTAQHPNWTFAAGLHEVRLTAQRSCRAVTTTRMVAAGRTLLGPTLLPATANRTGLFLMDFVVHAPDGVDLLGFDTAMPGCCDPAARLWVLVTPNGHAGVANDARHWRIGASGSTHPGSFANRVVFDRPLHLAPGSFGIALGFTGPPNAHTSIVNTASTAPFGNADITVMPGLYQTGPFFGGTPRGINGHFVYVRSGVDQTGGYGFFAEGCPTSAGVTQLASPDGHAPRIGRSFTPRIDPLPPTSPGLFLITGFDRTTTVLGPLPLDLSAFGLVGCELHVRDDVVTFHLTPSSPTLTIPNAPYLVGLPFYQQALILDPLLQNPARAALSDAVAAVVGR